jgi:hypothetical protein
MASLIRQLECLHCSHNRHFVVHTETTQRLLNQAELRDVPRGAHLTCARCGCASLISVWSDGAPFAASCKVPRRRRRRQVAADL